MVTEARVVAFVATQRPEQSKAFYQDVLGLRLVADEQHAIVFDANGTMVRVQKTAEVMPHPYTSLGFEVDDIVAAVRRLKDRGVEFEVFGFLQQDELGIWSPEGVTKVAWFKDPDGNLLSLTQFRAPVGHD
jgi:catechol 2,3-dioxygenase-like lactoylglutathione lyase family enzyme